MILRLVSSSETIILDDPSSSIWRVVSYVPQTPSVRSRSIATMGGDGETVADVEYENVSEPCVITLTEANQTAALTIVQAINRMFERARTRGNVPYSWYVLDDAGQPYGSPDGTVKLPNYVGDGPAVTLTPAVDNTLYILSESAVGGNAEILRTIQASVFVTPRKLSL